MAQGIKIFHPDGSTQLDTSEGVLTLLGFKSFDVAYPNNSGSFTDPNLAKGLPFYFVVGVPMDATYGVALASVITFSGTTCYYDVKPSIYGGGFGNQYGTLAFYYGYF